MKRYFIFHTAMFTVIMLIVLGGLCRYDFELLLCNHQRVYMFPYVIILTVQLFQTRSAQHRLIICVFNLFCEYVLSLNYSLRL